MEERLPDPLGEAGAEERPDGGPREDRGDVDQGPGERHGAGKGTRRAAPAPVAYRTASSRDRTSSAATTGAGLAGRKNRPPVTAR
jgi:hypothetical protein